MSKGRGLPDKVDSKQAAPRPLALSPYPLYKRVMVAIPTLNHQITDGITRFAHALGKMDGDPRVPINFDLHIADGAGLISFPVEYQRNRICKAFLESKCDALWFIDSDTMPSENSLELLRVPADVAAGLYLVHNYNKRGDVPMLWTFYNFSGEKEGTFDPIPLPPEESEQPLIECDGLATGCMIIARHVLEDKHMHFEDPQPDGTPVLFKTGRSPAGKCNFTDDLLFCQRARAAGYKLVAHTGIRWGHIKTLNLSDQYDALTEAVAFGAALAERDAQKESLIVAA